MNTFVIPIIIIVLIICIVIEGWMTFDCRKDLNIWMKLSMFVPFVLMQIAVVAMFVSILLNGMKGGK